jgi:UDP-N-acetylmuramyl tripeptide synthase
MCAAGAIYGYYGGKLPKGLRTAFEAVRLDPYGGRLTMLQAANGTFVLADYAHEKQSLRMVADLARTKLKPGGKLIGVVRLAHDRPDDVLKDTGVVVGKAYDTAVVYDKIDGYWRTPKYAKAFPQVVGRTSEIFADAIATVTPDVTRILREDEALAYAAKIAKPEDVVVAIVNDDIPRSIEFMKSAFKAEFV